MSGWDPGQYQRFAAERRQPFDDLLRLVEPALGLRVVDLGCGTGELTVELHQTLEAASTLGIDSSSTMLSKVPRAANVTFERRDIAELSGTWDLIFSNAALQWLPDHVSLLPRLLHMLAPGGQLAVQMPANYDHESHDVARELALQSPYREALGGYDRSVSVLAPEAYARMLCEAGCIRQHVRLQIYGHILGRTEDMLEWVKGTLLIPFRERLSEPLYEQFLVDYRKRLLERCGERSPFFYPFKRLLVWARR